MHAEKMTDVSFSMSIITANVAPVKHLSINVKTSYINFEIINLPNAANMPAAQNTSPHNAGKNSKPPIRSPKLSCKGSNIVT